jgi:hypothetical protein
MEAYRLLLAERTHWARILALGDPTTETMAAYGRAIMTGWDNQWLRAEAPSSWLVPAGCA